MPGVCLRTCVVLLHAHAHSRPGITSTTWEPLHRPPSPCTPSPRRTWSTRYGIFTSLLHEPWQWQWEDLVAPIDISLLSRSIISPRWKPDSRHPLPRCLAPPPPSVVVDLLCSRARPSSLCLHRYPAITARPSVKAAKVRSAARTLWVFFMM